ncbi:uncharacterized protein LOC144664353 isoform X1 [Oculina patagonica]
MNLVPMDVEQISNKPTTSEGSISELSSEDEDWDTDLEDSCAEKTNDITQEQMYLKACTQLGIPPASKFIKQMTTDKVDLRHYGLLDQGVQAISYALKRNITVDTLNLHDNGITRTGAGALADLLEENCFITSLDISGNNIGIEGNRAMERMLKNTSSLRELNFSDTCHNGGHVLPLLEGLKESFYLKVLDLSRNCLDDQGAGILGSILSMTSSLESLNVSWNNISTKGAVDLMDGLRECYTLKKLNFSWNSLSGAAAQALRNVLEANESLTYLDATNTSIGLPEAKIIAKGLKRNKTLQVLHIGKNPYLSPGAQAFLKAIRRNHESALQELHLEGITLDRDCHKELDEVLQKRPDFNCTWQISIQGGQAKEIRSPEKASPLDTFVRFARHSGLRMVDLFKVLSAKRDTIGQEAFIAGLKKMNIAMTKAELKKVFAILDVNKDGKLQFHEFPNLVALKLHEENLARKNCIAGKRK